MVAKKTTRAEKDPADLGPILETLQAQLAALAARLERLEAAGGAATAPAPAMPPQPAPAQAEPKAAAAAPPSPQLTEEEILAVSAALAAYLGVRVRIRQIRLLGSQAWAQQGRVSIQASHRLNN